MATSTPNYGWPVPQSPDPAQIPKDMLNLAIPIDAIVKEFSDRLEARENVFITHEGEGAYTVANGLGEAVPVKSDGDGTWQVLL
ncbi:hypothetical protein QM007_05330 [Rothia sp. SD9660Na]|uniref:hypothetical protein n=1 Tax=Rothia sp. SD9660Na TaxID=3047030 RepID=UPI0024BB0752|nr:hypothetical protein [Rothia sp. SD9660Na]WHS51382.1 hypothetical protein QM007_05330 [Rothia sp. SD9660Na]